MYLSYNVQVMREIGYQSVLFTSRYRRYKLLMYQHFQRIGQQIANMID